MQDNGKVNKRVLISLDGTGAFSNIPATNFMTSLPLAVSGSFGICTLNGVCCACSCVQCSIITMSPVLLRPWNSSLSLPCPRWHINVTQLTLVLKPVTPSHSHLPTNYGCERSACPHPLLATPSTPHASILHVYCRGTAGAAAAAAAVSALISK